MKKAAILVSLLLVSIFAFANGTVSGNDSTTTATTTQTTQSSSESVYQTYWYEGKQYTYVNYQDLIEQIKTDIEPELTAQITNELTSMLNEAFYEEIYTQVEADFSEMLNSEEIELYLGTFQNQLYDVIEIGEESVLGIINYKDDDTLSIGSGVVYKYDETNGLYYLITNYHVIEDAVRLEVRFQDETVAEATIIGYDTEVDIAILSFNASQAPNIVVSILADSDALSVSDFVLAIGNPIGFNFYNSVTLGIIAGLEREVDTNGYVKYIHHDAAINGGNSGGPIYNLDGEVIGINVSKFANDEVEGMGFAIPINIVKDIIARIEADDFEYHTIMPRFGEANTYLYFNEESIEDGEVFMDTLTLDDGTRYNIDIKIPIGISAGFIIRDIPTQSTFDGVLAPGDLIYRIDNLLVTDEDSFFDYIYETYESGDTANIYYYEFDPTGNEYFTEAHMVTITFK